MKFKKIIVLLFLLSSCNDNNESLCLINCEDNESSDITISLDIYKKIYGTSSEIYIENGYVFINTTSVPDHKSPYFENTIWEDEKYEEYDNSNPFVENFRLNPNRISELDIRFKIPNTPSKSNINQPTSMGPIGVSLNGVPFYNQYAGGGSPLTNEINSFDQYNGHPAPIGPGQENGSNGRYHYHMEPFWLSTNFGADALMGFLLDGYPVYGPKENQKDLRSSDLDEYHGHIHETKEFPNGIYHYHITNDDPYINGSGYYGTPGTVTN